LSKPGDDDDDDDGDDEDDDDVPVDAVVAVDEENLSASRVASM
jgi:hypothetical protein